MQMTQEEEAIINAKLEVILDHLQINQKEFQKNVMYHAKDKHKQARLLQIQKKSGINQNGKTLSKDKVIEVFKTQQDIQLR